MNKVKLLVSALCLTAFISSCKKDNLENPGTNEIPAAELNLGSAITADFAGQILDQNKTPIEGALVEISGQKTLTDENGIFRISDVSTKEKLAYLKVEKDGYFVGGRSVIPRASATNMIKVILIEKTLSASVFTGSEMSVNLSTGPSIDFKGEFVNANGLRYEGEVNVYAYYLDPTIEQTFLEMPGNLYAQNVQSEEGILTSFGMLAVELEGSNGELLQIANGSSATLHMPVPEEMAADASSSIPLWFFDEEAGYWIEEGEAILQDGDFVGEVKHFTFWNYDYFNDITTLEGYSISTTGDTIGNQSLSVTAGSFYSISQTNSDGYYWTYIPANTAIEFSFIDDCNNEIPFSTAGPYSAGTNNYHDLLIPEQDLSLSIIKGSVVNCDGNPVTNGEIIVQSALYSGFIPVTNGSFTLALFNCDNNGTFTLFAYDYDSNTNSGILEFTFSNPSTFVGTIDACDTGGNFSEILSYSIDGNPDQEYTSNIYCHQLLSGSTPYFKIFPEDDTSIVIQGWTFNIGTHEFVSSSPGMNIEILPDGIDLNEPYDITVVFNNYGGPGELVSLNFTGHWSDQSAVLHTISGYLVASRDS